MADEQHYTFIGGPRHWDGKNFGRMGEGAVINILEDHGLNVHVWPVPDDFAQGMLAYHAYTVRTFRNLLYGSRSFLVHEDLHRLDANDMVEEYISHNQRRQQDGHNIHARGGEHSQDY